MKRERLLSCLMGILLSAVLGISGVLCLITGFSLNRVDVAALLAWSVGAAVIFSLCFIWKLGLVPACAMALLGGYLWRAGTLAYSTEALVNWISTLYSMGYHWPVLGWSGRELEGVDLTPALCAVSLLVIGVVSWTVCRGKPALPATLVSVLPVASCVVVTDTVPRAIWLFTFLLGLSLLLISQTLRRKNAAESNRLLAIVLAPTVLGLGILFCLLPQEGYGQNSMGTMGQALSDWVEQVLTYNQSSYVNVSGGAVDLGKVGNRKESEATIMEVTTQYAGNLYLRSYSYDTYYANYWTNGGQPQNLPWAGYEMMEQAGQVQITTAYVHPKLFLPYYCEGLTGEDVGRGIGNYTDTKSYGYTLFTLAPDAALQEEPLTPSDSFTALPEETLQWAKQMVETITPEKTSALQIARDIRNYVSRCAEYDLGAPRMPSRFDDFAHWFLTEADEGYCIHFATAATVLLRAAGIPARYTTGYLVQTQPGETVAVKGKNAHAWVEYWVEGIGWLVLEPTPARQIEQIAQTQVSEQTLPQETTEPEQTAAATQTQETEPQNKPAPTTPKPQTQKKKPTQNGGGSWIAAGCLLGLAVAVPIQWRLRLWLRKRQRSHGRINKRIVAAWRESVYLARLLGEKPDKGLFALAQKAKFSQYILNEEVLGLFEGYIFEATQRLRQKPRILRLIYRLVFAAY